jgi:hypothetical protein
MAGFVTSVFTLTKKRYKTLGVHMHAVHSRLLWLRHYTTTTLIMLTSLLGLRLATDWSTHAIESD